MLTRYFTCSLIATFYLAHMEHFWTFLTCINYKLLIIFEQVDVYLNEPIKMDEQIKLANQLIQMRTRDRNGKDNDSSCFWKQKNKLVIRSIEIKKGKKNLI